MYDSIAEMPVMRWHRIGDVGLKLLLKENKEIEKKDEFYFEFIKSQMSEQLVDYVGLDKGLLNVLEQSKKVARMKLDMIITGNKAQALRIQIEEKRLEDMQQGMKSKGGSFFETKLAIEKRFGLTVTEQTTMKEFYHYVKLFTNE